MSSTLEANADPATIPTRRPAVLAALIAVPVLVVMTVVVLVVRRISADREADGYRPLEISNGSGVWYAPDRNANHLAGEYDTLHLAGPAGTEQRVLVPLFVNGSHDVRITSVAGSDLVARVQWSEYVSKEGGYLSGENRPWRSFPTTVGARSVIRLGIVLRKPAGCGSGLSHQWDPSITVRWQALGRSHVEFLRAVDEYTLWGCGG